MIMKLASKTYPTVFLLIAFVFLNQAFAQDNNEKIDRSSLYETVYMPDGIYVRMITLALHANKERTETGRWMLKDHTANDVLRRIEELKPDCLERFITGKQDPDLLVPVDKGEKPMTVVQFLNKAVEAGSDKCIIIPKLNLKWGEKRILESAQNLYDLPLKKPIRNINLDCWADIKGEWSEGEIKSLLKKIKKIGYEIIGVNMTGGYHPGYGYIDYMDFNIDTKNWEVNKKALNKLKNEKELKKFYMYIDYPGAMDRFRAEHTTDEQADIYVNRIQPFEHKLGFTFVYPIFQDDWDATKEFTSKEGEYNGKSMFDLTKMLIEKTRKKHNHNK